MGKYDLPAMFETITQVSGNEKLTYIGFSQGTTQLLYGLATQQETYAQKLEKAILLAPAAYPASTENELEYYGLIYPVFEAEFVNSVLRSTFPH